MNIFRDGVLFIVLLASCVWLSVTGRPLDTLIFTMHKLVGLGILIYLIVKAYRANQTMRLNLTEISVSVSTVILFIGVIAAGGVLSLEYSAPAIIWLVHQIGPILVILSAASMLYLLHHRSQKQQINA